jgi:putative ABC transport system permease protein
LAESLLTRGRIALAWLLQPLARKLSPIIAASLSRQRLLLSRGILLVTLAVSFAVSTAVFNTTFNAQARIDAELTNGSDVTVTVPPPSDLRDRETALAAISGVAGTALMQHRFAYVGNDLQDMYGINPLRIADATSMSDEFFANGSAAKTLAALATQRDGVLVSEETARDFELKPGDLLNLRLQHVRDHRYHVVPFHFMGVVREFPTAPKDSFLVANSAYIAQQTGSNENSIMLMRSTMDPAVVAVRARAAVSQLAGAQVSDVGAAQRAVSSSLTAVDLHGLTRLELVFAILFIAAATGLVFALGLAERRRTFTILSALGAKSSQLGAFVWSEAFLLLLAGIFAGVGLGLGVAQMLVKLLTGVFDPPPQALVVPWAYLTLLAASAILSTTIAALAALLALRNPGSEALRE